MYRHVLCVYPYRRTPSSITSFPPVGLEYVAAALRPYTEKIEVINFRHERLPNTRQFIKPETDLVCYCINWRRELDEIREDILSLPPGLPVILGGRTATEDPRFWMEACPNVVAIVCGDGEHAIAEIGQGRPWSEVAGLVHRGPDGNLIHNPPRANMPLDENLTPARDLRKKPYYLTSKGISTGIKLDIIVGSRGCPFHCRFCNFSVNPWGVKRKWTPRSVDSVVDEIASIDADLVFFVDDVFTYDPDRVAAICDALIAKGIRKHYVVNARLEIANRPDVLRKMEQAGFIALLLGVESTQDATLKSMGKGFNTAQIRERFEVIRKSRMLVNAYFIVGNIGETEEQMLSTAPFARSLGVDLIHVSRLRNEPYSGLQELVDKLPDYHIDEEGFVYSDAYSAKHIAELRKKIDRRFHSPMHIVHVVTKLAKNLHGHILPRILLTMPIFLAKLLVSQTHQKLHKWLTKLRRPKARLTQGPPPPHHRRLASPGSPATTRADADHG